MLQKLRDRHDVCPPKVVGDQIYGAGKTRALVDQVSQGHTQLIALMPDYEKRTDRFAPADFTLSMDGGCLTCPHGVTSTRRYLKPGADGDEFRFTAKGSEWGSAGWPVGEPDICQSPPSRGGGSRQRHKRNIRVSYRFGSKGSWSYR